jgi:hypothetical protein
MSVLVDVGCWRLTSDRPTVGMVEIVYRSNFFLFLRRSHIFLTSDLAAKKGRLRHLHFALKVVVMPRVIRYSITYS